jgi:integrase
MQSKLSEISIYKLNSRDIVDFSNKLLLKNLSPKTVNDVLLIVNALIKYSCKFYGINTIEISYIREERKEMRVLSVNEQKTFESYLKSDVDNYKFGVLFALYTGVRIGELCALQWKDIKNGTVRINKTMYRLRSDNGSSVVIDTPKTVNSNRTIPLPKFLNKYVELFRGNPDEYVLSSKRLSIVEPRLMQIKFKKMTQECNFENVTFHTLRHTFATRCVECGFDIKSLSEILGHADVKTTLNKYVHSSMELKQSNMDKLEKIAI